MALDLDLKALGAKLAAARAVVLTTHSGPDGDGLGCLVALRHALENQGKRVLSLIPDPLGDRYRFLDPEQRMRVPSQVGSEGEGEWDFALVLDTHDPGLLRDAGAWLNTRQIPIYFLDHHPMIGDRAGVYGDIDAVATGCLIYRMLKLLGWPIRKAEAEPIYIALSFDTNSFKYLRNDPEALLIAADLIRAGVDTSWVYRNLFASNPMRKARALGWMLSHVRFEAEGRLASISIPYALVQDLALDRDDLRDGITHLLEIEGVEIAAALKEMYPREVKISLRSKGKYTINGVAQALGGGGHTLAAGCEVNGDLEHAWNVVGGRLREVLGESPAPALP